MGIFGTVRIGIIVAAAAGFASAGAQAAFMPVIDEFWVGRNGAELFRDSFNNGVLPQAEGTIAVPTYGTGGAAGFVSETVGTAAEGKLTMNPALGDGAIITSGFVDSFTGATYRTSIGGGANALNQASSFAVHGLFDLSSLPEVLGDAMGIRLSDRVPGTGSFAQPGNDIMQLSVRYGGGGSMIVSLALLDDVANSVTVLDLQPFLTVPGLTATQVELVLSKQAGLDTIEAAFTLFDQFGGTMQTETLFAGTSELIPIFNGEDFTRAQFFSSTSVPVSEGPMAVLFGLGLAGMGAVRRRGKTRA